MTNEEAINQLQYRIDTASQFVGKGMDGKAYEDLEMAISALEKLDKIEKTLTLMREKGNSEEYHNEGYKTMLLELETLGNIQKIVIQ